MMLVLGVDPLSAAAFNVSNCPWACASQTRRLKFPPMFLQLFLLHSNLGIICTYSNLSPSQQAPDDFTFFVTIARGLASRHATKLTPICLSRSSGLWPESAPAARHDRAWCHQAGGNPPSRRETPPPWAAVPHEVSSPPPWRHRRLHQWGKRTVQQQSKEIVSFCDEIGSPERSRNESISAVTELEFHFQAEWLFV